MRIESIILKIRQWRGRIEQSSEDVVNSPRWRSREQLLKLCKDMTNYINKIEAEIAEENRETKDKISAERRELKMLDRILKDLE